MIAHPSPAVRTDRERTLRTELRSLGELIENRVTLPISGVTVEIVRPVDTDLLLDRVADDPEQNLPYWAEVWPSGIALADAIASAPDIVRGQRILELGAGLGVTAIAALTAGAKLTITDYSLDALRLCRLNAIRQTGREPHAIQINWRQPGVELLDQVGTGYPIVLAADALYEQRDVEPLLTLIERLIASGGMLWLAEPGRAVARAFRALLDRAGWSSQSNHYRGPWPDPKDAEVVVGVHRIVRDPRLTALMTTG